MRIEEKIAGHVYDALVKLFGQEVDKSKISLQPTRKDFVGDFTVVVFPFVKMARKSPEQTAQLIGEEVKSNMTEVTAFNVIKGFLNFSLSPEYWFDYLQDAAKDDAYGLTKVDEAHPVVVEYSSPNTNKPLHLGHIRNNLLGYSVAQILEASGRKTLKVNLVNDRGIHICKSMLAWMKWGDGETPESAGKKGDKLVGEYYVRFETELRKEAQALKEAHQIDDDQARNDAPLMHEARELLRKWEARDEETVRVWEMMNKWVYKGFDSTYQRMGVSFDKIYYESDT